MYYCLRAALLSCFVWGFSSLFAQTDPAHPNVLLIIADDLGVDVSNGYQLNTRMPTTPTLDSLREAGITFQNAWAYAACAPTRAAIMSGKLGIKTGVTTVPGNLALTDTSVFTKLSTLPQYPYAGAVIGKWHISSPVDYDHPANPAFLSQDCEGGIARTGFVK